jgi:hypothetical protein
LCDEQEAFRDVLTQEEIEQAEAEWLDAHLSPAALSAARDEARELWIAEARAAEARERDQRLIGVAEAAHRLGLDHKTVRARVKSGEIPLYGTSRAHRVRWGDVLASFTLRPARSKAVPVVSLRPAPRRRGSGRFSRLAS